MQQNPTLIVDAVDTSAAMLSLLRVRCERNASNVASRLKTHQTDALVYLTTSSPEKYDLVVTHFFIDCLTQAKVQDLASAISPLLAPEVLWLVSDFRIPTGIVRLPAKLLIRSLYVAFRLLTGLRTDRLPDHTSALSSSGLVCQGRTYFLLGMLSTEIWTTRLAFRPRPPGYNC